MALDEVFLLSPAEPVLRVYQWRPACLSLGYGQRLAEIDRDGCAARGVDVTRRLTGGRAVLHAADELTYSVILPAALLPVGRNISAAYDWISGGLRAALAQLGIEVERTERHGAEGHDPACFASALGGDLAVDGRKLLGSAQCHKYGGILQHGSLPVTVDDDLLAGCLHRPPTAAPRAWTCLADLGRSVTPERFGQALAAGFAPLLGAPLFSTPRADRPTAAEWALADRLVREKYGAESWTGRI
jgi:lipoate-protein ligase A